MPLKAPKKERADILYPFAGDSPFEMIRIPGPPSNNESCLPGFGVPIRSDSGHDEVSPKPGRDAEHFLWEGQWFVVQ